MDKKAILGELFQEFPEQRPKVEKMRYDDGICQHLFHEAGWCIMNDNFVNALKNKELAKVEQLEKKSKRLVELAIELFKCAHGG